MAPKFHVYTFCWNEELILPYFLRHYETVAERIYVFDNLSTDRTSQIAAAHAKVEVTTFDSGGEFNDDVMGLLRNHAWKHSRGAADWVAVVDADEFLHHPDLLGFLFQCSAAEVTICQPQGYMMVSQNFPVDDGSQLWELVRTGMPHDRSSKPVLFDPLAIEETNFNAGCHEAGPVGRVKMSIGEVKLLHYHMLGMDYMVPRYAQRRTRIERLMKTKNYGIQYSWERDRLERRLKKALASATEVV